MLVLVRLLRSSGGIAALWDIVSEWGIALWDIAWGDIVSWDFAPGVIVLSGGIASGGIASGDIASGGIASGGTASWALEIPVFDTIIRSIEKPRYVQYNTKQDAFEGEWGGQKGGGGGAWFRGEKKNEQTG